MTSHNSDVKMDTVEMNEESAAKDFEPAHSNMQETQINSNHWNMAYNRESLKREFTPADMSECPSKKPKFSETIDGILDTEATTTATIPTYHSKDCPSDFGEVQRLTNTPPLPSSPPPVVPRDICQALKEYDRFCRRAIACLPQIPLAPHRYWIGVLNVGVRITKPEFKERDITWMMGNRLTSIETVWHTYCNQCGTDDFVLHCAGEAVHDKTQMRQLDYFNNKKIYLRAVEKDDMEAAGRKLIPDDEVEVIELDD